MIRKHMGYIHIAREYDSIINEFYHEYMNVYLNFHRPSGFATVITDRKGKQKKKYDTYLTPLEKTRIT